MKSLIVDDQYTASEYLASLIEEHCPEVEAIDTVNDPMEAISLIQEKDYDVLFLDIEMPELDGFELIEQVGLNKLPSVVFTTAYNNHASKAFGVNAVHYLLKPVKPELLRKAVRRVHGAKSPGTSSSAIKAMENIHTGDNKIVLASGEDYFITKFDDIVRVHGEGSYATFYLLNGDKIMTSRRLAYYLDKFRGQSFLKTHQSHLVNLKHVIKYSKQNGGELFLQNDQCVPVSSRMRQEVLKALHLK